jgi:hypothetical protein
MQKGTAGNRENEDFSKILRAVTGYGGEVNNHRASRLLCFLCDLLFNFE